MEPAAAGLIRRTPVIVDDIYLMSCFDVGTGTGPVLQDVVAEIVRTDGIDNLRLSAVNISIVIVVQ